jgi:hypothetical protein
MRCIKGCNKSSFGTQSIKQNKLMTIESSQLERSSTSEIFNNCSSDFGFHKMLGTTEWLHNSWPLERYSTPQS